MNITITNQINDLTRQAWRFEASIGMGGALWLRLEEWRIETRATKRHKWVPSCEGHWHRWLDGRQSKAANVPFPDEIVEQAKAEVANRLIVVGPQDPEKRS